MSEFIQVGVTAMRDPKTGEPLEAVPLYIERTTGGGPPLPEINIRAFAQEFIQKMKAQELEQKKIVSRGDC